MAELVLAGGSGWGPPGERAPEALARDLRLGFVSDDGVARDYGLRRSGEAVAAAAAAAAAASDSPLATAAQAGRESPQPSSPLSQPAT